MPDERRAPGRKCRLSLALPSGETVEIVRRLQSRTKKRDYRARPRTGKPGHAGKGTKNCPINVKHSTDARVGPPTPVVWHCRNPLHSALQAQPLNKV
jgi:hypothetical protein